MNPLCGWLDLELIILKSKEEVEVEGVVLEESTEGVVELMVT